MQKLDNTLQFLTHPAHIITQSLTLLLQVAEPLMGFLKVRDSVTFCTSLAATVVSFRHDVPQEGGYIP